VSLLEAETRNVNPDFLNHSPILRQTVFVTEKAGDRIGRYKLLQQLGEGGCGVVYLAEQEEPVRRQVALKVIKLGMNTKSVIARFEAERQALALMDHPNIAKVLDAGATETGRPFFVMELVRGTRITDYCDQNSLAIRHEIGNLRAEYWEFAVHEAWLRHCRIDSWQNLTGGGRRSGLVDS